MDTRKIEVLTENKEAYGTKNRIKIVKNKLAPPFREVILTNYFGYGFSKEADIIDEAVKVKVIEKMGSWYSYGDKKLGQGQKKVIELLKTDKALYDELYKKVMDIHNEK